MSKEEEAKLLYGKARQSVTNMLLEELFRNAVQSQVLLRQAFTHRHEAGLQQLQDQCVQTQFV